MKTALHPQSSAYAHLPGVHCSTAALRGLVRHAYKTCLSEAAVFGIASGLNFTYCRFPGSRLIYASGRGTDLELFFADALGVAVESRLFLDDALAWEYLRNRLNEQEVVMLDTDSLSLPYLHSAGLLPDTEEIHFGGHKLLISGLIEDRQHAVLHDYAWGEPLLLPFAQLQRARNPPNCVMSPPQNRTYVFRFGEQSPNWRNAMLMGLLRAAPLLRSSNQTTTGLPALDRFCRQVTRWPRLLDEADAYLNTRVAGFLLDKGGTGGGAFRRMYSRFLQECAEQFHDGELAETAQLYRTLGGLWTEVACLLTEASKDLAKGLYEPGHQNRRLLDEIWRKENEGVAALEQISTRLVASVWN